MPTIEDAIALAAQAHKGQVDKLGYPYIFHPLEVMRDFSIEQNQIAAILHDVIEDTDITLDVIRTMGYSDQVVNALDALTRRDGETYKQYILRLSDNPIACLVKRADLKHNIGRLDSLPASSKKEELRKRYSQAVEFLDMWMN